MEKTLYCERLYSLGDFKNIKFSQAITQIPESFASNPEAVNFLYVDMFLSMELAYRKYYAMVENLARERVVDVISTLHTEQERNFAEFTSAIGTGRVQSLEPNQSNKPQEEETN